MTTPLSITAKNAIRALLKEHNINARGMSDADLLTHQATLQGEEIHITELPNNPPRDRKPSPKTEIKPELTPVPTPTKPTAQPADVDSAEDISLVELHRTMLNTMEINNRIMRELLDHIEATKDK